MLFGGLDAFRRHLHAEAAAQADDGMNDGRGIGSLLDRAHETRIDLELVERKTPQIKQARIAGAEIIERKTHADAFEPQHREFRALEITEQGAFVEFEFELVGRKAGLAENSLNRLDEIRPPELQRRNIDRDRHARPIAPVEAARRRMYSPSSTIRPECSAIGIKRAGGISPCTGWIQRASASTPTSRPPLRSTIG